MNGAFAIEAGLSLCMQLSLVVLFTHVLQRWAGTATNSCRLWSICFIAILGLVTAAILLPHRRVFSFPDSVSRDGLVFIANWQATTAVVLLVLWTVGLAFKLVRSVFAYVQLSRFLDSYCDLVPLAKVSDGGVDVNLASLMQSFPKPDVQILVSDLIEGPFCWQFHRPIIVLPKYLFEGDSSSLEHVLLHEVEHLRTKHPMQHFLQGVCSHLFWFHPAVWSAGHGAELAREFLCDEAAAVRCGKFGAYLRTLVTIAERCASASCTHVPKGALAFGNRKSCLVKRSDRLVALAESDATGPAGKVRSILLTGMLIVASAGISQVWLPTNAMASSRSRWSPWPTWTASVLHSFDIHVRDFEPFDEQTAMHELLDDED